MSEKLTKTLYVGEFTVELATNRSLMVEVMRKFPKFRELFFSVAKVNKQNSIVNEETAKELGDNWTDMIELVDMMPDIANYVFVKMAQLANPSVADDTLKPIIDKVKQGNGEELFAKTIVEFLLSGFTQDKPAPTIGIALS